MSCYLYSGDCSSHLLGLYPILPLFGLLPIRPCTTINGPIISIQVSGFLVAPHIIHMKVMTAASARFAAPWGHHSGPMLRQDLHKVLGKPGHLQPLSHRVPCHEHTILWVVL